MGMGFKCAVHVHRSIVPLEIHHVFPLGMGGLDVASNKMSVCSNGHSAIHDLLSKLVKAGGKLSWTQKRHYGFRIRRLAQRGYNEWKIYESSNNRL
jgi:hypothetical protein